MIEDKFVLFSMLCVAKADANVANKNVGFVLVAYCLLWFLIWPAGSTILSLSLFVIFFVFGVGGGGLCGGCLGVVSVLAHSRLRSPTMASSLFDR